jgi:Cdc6-like AAA superfamily ATPase
MMYQIFNRFKYRRPTEIGKIIFAIIVAFLGWLFNVWAQFYLIYSELTINKRVLKAFEEASERQKDKKIETGKYINRTKVEDKLLKLFELENNYALIYGEHGAGKITSVKYVLKKAHKQGIPVLYFPVETQEGLNFLECFVVAVKGFDVIPKTYSLEWRDLLKSIWDSQKMHRQQLGVYSQLL